MTGNGIYRWSTEMAEATLAATRAAMKEDGVTISLAADVPTDHAWWDGDGWINLPALDTIDAWWPVIHRPKNRGNRD